MSNIVQGKAIDIVPTKQACSDCSLQQLCLPVGISKSDIRRLDDIIKRRRVLPRDSHVFRFGDKFRMPYAIRSGSVKVTIQPSWRTVGVSAELKRTPEQRHVQALEARLAKDSRTSGWWLNSYFFSKITTKVKK